VFLQSVFDGQFVKVELALQVGQRFGVGLLQPDPDEVAWLACPFAAFIDTDVGDLPTGAVYRRCHDSPHDCPLFCG